MALSGKLTKAASLLSNMDKEYEAVFRFGKETDTLDTEGSVIAESRVPEYAEIEKSLHFFEGEITQVPPSFSAIKINGKRAYAQARKGLAIEIPERKVQIYKIELISWCPPDLKLNIHCSKGTYIRSIARDLGIASGSRAYCLSLRRSAIGPFSVDNGIIPDLITREDGLNPVIFFKNIGIPVQELSDDITERMRVGVPVDGLPEKIMMDENLTLFTDLKGNPVALMEIKEERIKYRIVFDGF